MFREYDIRGRIDKEDEFSDEAVDAIGRGFAVFLHRRGIKDAIVACDARPYNKKVKELTTQALRESGINVFDIGTVLVPIFYFSQYHLQKKGGVMVTASHNPWGWSGFKQSYDYSTTFLPKEMEEIYDIVTKGEWLKGEGAYTEVKGVIEAYAKDALSHVEIRRPLKVLVDAGNGTAGPIAPEILRAAGCSVVEQFTNVSEKRDHEANPSTLGMIQAMADGVRKHKADIGIGFDDDGDRMGAVDEKGQAIWPDRILMLLARPVLKKHPGAKIVFDVKCTQGLVDDITARGGVPILWKTGHSYIKQKMKEEKAPLAGERSGHIFFSEEHYGFDDGVFAALKLLEFLAHEEKLVSEIMAELPHYITSPVWHVPCSDEAKYRVVEDLTKQFKEEYGALRVIDINGARVYLESGWGLVRASSNVPALVVVFEAKTEHGVQRIESIFREKLSKFPEIGNEWTSG